MSAPYYADDAVTLLLGDSLELLTTLDACSVDAVITDPPYGLGFMGHEWDQPGSPATRSSGRPLRTGREAPTDPDTGELLPGAMQAGRYDFSRSANARFGAWCEVWLTECLRVLRPGGHCLVFGAPRTWHRVQCAAEDAGFDIRDSIAWLFGSGFPKSLNIGAGRGTALKPAFEPVVVGRKPLVGTVAANVLEHGTGALNIDVCRTAGERVTTSRTTALGLLNDDGWQPVSAAFESHPAGRWPTNVVLDEAAADDLDRQTGELHSGTMRAGTERQARNGGTIYGADTRNFVPADTYGDSGGASRFFPTFRYEAKASRAERPRAADGTAHPTVKPLDLMRWLVRLVTPPGGLVLDPFLGSGTTAEACILEGFRCLGIEREAKYLRLCVEGRLAKPLSPVLDFAADGAP